MEKVSWCRNICRKGKRYEACCPRGTWQRVNQCIESMQSLETKTRLFQTEAGSRDEPEPSTWWESVTEPGMALGASVQELGARLGLWLCSQRQWHLQTDLELAVRAAGVQGALGVCRSDNGVQARDKIWVYSTNSVLQMCEIHGNWLRFVSYWHTLGVLQIFHRVFSFHSNVRLLLKKKLSFLNLLLNNVGDLFVAGRQLQPFVRISPNIISVLWGVET